MAAITYTATRELEATGYAKNGTDISVAGGDDSFNAVSTVLSGLLAGQWVNTAGFANAANNGWFHINVNSLAAKITQDTTTSLVTELAGAAVTLTGYKRGYGQQYSMDFGVEQANRQFNDQKSVHQPIGGGQPETIFYRTDKLVMVRTGVIDEASLAQWREFMASVAGGETFTLDRYGSVASPVEAKVAIVDTKSYTEEREGVNYPGKYRIGFSARLLT